MSKFSSSIFFPIIKISAIALLLFHLLVFVFVIYIVLYDKKPSKFEKKLYSYSESGQDVIKLNELIDYEYDVVYSLPLEYVPKEDLDNFFLDNNYEYMKREGKSAAIFCDPYSALDLILVKNKKAIIFETGLCGGQITCTSTKYDIISDCGSNPYFKFIRYQNGLSGRKFIKSD